MSGTLRVAICDPQESSREKLKNYLLGIESVWLEADCSRYDFFADVVAQTTPDAAIIDLDSDPEKGLGLIESLKATHPNCGLVAISRSTDGQLILRAIRAGAREFVNSPVRVDELVAALERVGEGTTGNSRSKSGTIITVAGSSGGVGTTSVAVNLACSLARNPQRSVVLVDLDLSLGDADVFLDSIPEYTLLDVVQSISRLDLALLRKSLTKHSSGVYLLPRPVHLQEIDTISADDFSRVISLLKASFTHLVIDLSKSFNRMDMAALQAARHVILLTQLDLPCLRNVVRLLMSLEAYDGISEKVKIVVNRSGLDKGQINIKKAEETIGRQIYWQIPNYFSLVSESRNNGVPLVQLAPKAPVTQNLCDLAESLAGTEAAAAAADDRKKKGSWLSFLSK